MTLLVPIAIFLFVLPTNPQSPQEPQQIHLALGKDVTEFIVTWSTMDKAGEPIVQYGVHKMNLTSHGTSYLFNSSSEHFQYIHKVVLSNLKPLENYIYRCGSDSGWSSQYNFTSLPLDNDFQPHIALYGDMGEENPEILDYVKRDVRDKLFHLILHVGDIAYDMNEDNGKRADRFMNLIQPIAVSVPYMTAPGNHENANNFSEYKARFNMPGSPNNISYSFNIGPLHIVSISTEAYYFTEYGFEPALNQYEWLTQDLEEASKPENRKKRPWIVVMGHRPMYCSTIDGDDCTNPETAKTRVGIPEKKIPGLEELLRKYQVDLVVWAHKHCYERLWPVYDLKVYNGSLSAPYENPGATVHITTGAAGNREKLDSFNETRPIWSAFRSSEYGYSRLKAYNGTHLSFDHISTSKGGKIVDSIMIVKNYN